MVQEGLVYVQVILAVDNSQQSAVFVNADDFDFNVFNAVQHVIQVAFCHTPLKNNFVNSHLV